MNVIRHYHIPTYCQVEIALCAFGEKNKRSVDLIPCQEPLSFVCAERDEIKRTCCEDPSQTWSSPSEITLHEKSYSSLNKTVAAVAMALRAVIQSLVEPATGWWLVSWQLSSCAAKQRVAARSCRWRMLTKGQARVVVGSVAALLFQTRTVTGATRLRPFCEDAQPDQLVFTSRSYLTYEQYSCLYWG
jgi:hypothetical protein